MPRFREARSLHVHLQERVDEARELVAVALGACEAVQSYDGASYTLEPAADKLRNDAGVPIGGPRLDAARKANRPR